MFLSHEGVPEKRYVHVPMLFRVSLAHPYFRSFLMTFPPFITNLTRCISVMSCSGSPENGDGIGVFTFLDRSNPVLPSHHL
jgi:hypothetical protein